MRMMEAIVRVYRAAKKLVERGVPVSRIAEAGAFDTLGRMKYDIPNDHLEQFDTMLKTLEGKLREIEQSFSQM